MLTAQGKERREPIFDTLTAAKQTTVKTGTRLFTSGMDSKTVNKTNLEGDGEFPASQRHDVYGIRVDFGDTPKADIIGLCKNLVGRLVVSGKPEIVAPLKYFAAGMGVNGEASNGVPDARAVLEFPENYKIPIEAGEKFYFELTGEDYLLTDAATGLYMQVLLDGLHTVPVN